MDKKSNIWRWGLLVFLLAAVGAVCFLIGQNVSAAKAQAEKELNYKINRSELDGLGEIEGTIYVIGHKRPDSDTVGSSIAYAALLRKMGYDAVVLEELRDAGLLDYFDEIVTGDMVKNSKPAPDIFLLACEKIGAAPELAFAIEDSFNGIRAAANGKLRPIMVPDLRQPDEEIRKLAEAVEESLTEVIRYLEG